MILVHLTRPGFAVKFTVEDEHLDAVIDLCNRHFGDSEWDAQQELAKQWWPSRKERK